jgi:hypothetical protein
VVTSLPLRQLGVRHRLEKFRPDAQHALERAEPTLGWRRVDGRQPCDRNLTAGNDASPPASTRARSLERLVFGACMVTVDIVPSRLSP